MKNLTFRFTIFLLICLTIPVTATAQAVVIPDANLRAAVETALDKASGDPISQDELGALRSLNGTYYDISDLTGLEGAANLSTLYLSSNSSLSDISALAGLTNLTYLDLESNAVSDISALAGLTNLTSLSLYGNSVSDISALAGLTNLTSLSLYRNSVSDISALAGLTNLTYLDFGVNSVSDISALASLTNLQTLYLSSASVSDISALAGLTNLTELDLWGNSVSDISALAGLTNLTSVGLDSNSVSDISALAGLTNLTSLGLGANSVSDISALAGLTNLTFLGLDSNSVSDILALAGLTNLTSLGLSANSLSYVSINTYIPALQNRGVNVSYDSRAPAALLKVSGELTASDSVMIVEVRDGNDHPFEGVPVTFSVISGGGALSVTDTAADSQGRAQSQLNFGSDGTPNRVEVSAAGIQQSVTFSEEGDISDVVAGSVTFPDANLRAAVETALGKASGDPITQDEMATLTKLSASGANISDLTGLEFAGDLTLLELSDNSISDISALAGLTNLQALFLGSNSLSDVSVLANLTNLSSLSLSGNTVSAISALAGLTNLGSLELRNNEVSDISALSRLTNLTRLLLNGNRLLDVSALSGLTNLVLLDLHDNGLSDISDLAGLANSLLYLRLRQNPLSYPSIHTHISALENRGVTVSYDSRTPAALLKISGELTASDNVMIVEVRDGNDHPFEGVPVTFSVISGGGTLSVTDTATDSQGRAQSQLSFGSDGTPNRVEVSAAGIQQKAFFGAASDDAPTDDTTADDGMTETPSSDTVISTSPATIQSTEIGGQFSVSIDIARGVNVASYAIKLTYDSSALSLVSLVNADYFPTSYVIGPSPTLPEAQGQVTFTVISAEGPSNGDGALATATFEVVKVANSSVSLEKAWVFDDVGSVMAVAVQGTDIPGATSADVNGDGVVDIADLVVIAQNYGQSGANAADVNGDGVVDAQDFVLAAGAVGASYTAAPPVARHQASTMLSAHDVRRALTEARALNLADPAAQRGILYLERLLEALIPNRTLLLANYPNPFNPETWIPYRLAEDAVVTLTIYDAHGQAVRTLAVGHRIAAVYERQSDAIYWDGKNDLGERVGSGVYFYHLSAGDYSATRKMVILK